MDNEVWTTISIYGYKVNIKSNVDENYDDNGLNDYEKLYHRFLLTIQDLQDKYFTSDDENDVVGSNKFSLEVIMPSVDKTYEMGNADISTDNQCIVVIGIKNPTGNLKDLIEKHNALLQNFATKKEIFQDYKLDSDPNFYSGIPWFVSPEDMESSTFDDSDSEYETSEFESSDSETTSSTYTTTSDD